MTSKETISFSRKSFVVMGGAGVRSMDLLIRLVLRLEAGDEASMTKHRVPLG
jgi:hypothetical protein